MNVFGEGELYVQQKIAKMASCILYVFCHNLKKRRWVKSYWILFSN